MEKKCIAILSLGLLIFYASPSFSAPVTSENWNLVWSDEFDYFGQPDSQKWEFDVGGDGFGNDELQYYTDRTENAFVEQGYLSIRANRELFLGNAYTSAKLKSKGAGWKYGRIEVRAKLPSGSGTWPAVWMLAKQQTFGDNLWPDNGEIDIVEHVGRDPNYVLGCFYTKNFNWMQDTGKSELVEVPDSESAFHVYSLEWNDDQAVLSVDGVPFNTFINPHTDWGDWPFAQNYYIMMNLAIGGGFGGTVDDSIFPQTLLIDYIRVYEATPAIASI